MAQGETVLVSGGSGYIGGWCVVTLLQRGYSVRTTIRDLSREAGVRAAIAGAVDPEDRLAFFAANLTSDAGWDAAAAWASADPIEPPAPVIRTLFPVRDFDRNESQSAAEDRESRRSKGLPL